MRICPYVAFNGNCAEAVAFYEKVFNAKAEMMRYKDAPPSEEFQSPEGTENLVMHAQFEINGEMVMLCDVPPGSSLNVGENIAIMAEFDCDGSAKAAFAALKEGGTVTMDIQKTFWSECFGSLTDRFGINWNISVGCPAE